VGYYADEQTRDGVRYVASVDQRIIRDVAGFSSLLGGHDHFPRTVAVPRYSGMAKLLIAKPKCKTDKLSD
jgi:hypothetical protein